MKWRNWIGGVVLWGMVAFGVGVLSDARVKVLPDDMTEMQLVIRYSGKLLGECQAMSSAEIDELAPNMRRTTICPREKSPLYAELQIDDEVRFRDTIAPSGLHNDGVLAAYEKLAVPAGTSTIRLRVRDDTRHEGFTHTFEQEVRLTTDNVVTIHFDDRGIRLTGSGV